MKKKIIEHYLKKNVVIKCKNNYIYKIIVEEVNDEVLLGVGIGKWRGARVNIAYSDIMLIEEIPNHKKKEFGGKHE